MVGDSKPGRSELSRKEEEMSAFQINRDGHVVYASTKERVEAKELTSFDPGTRKEFASCCLKTIQAYDKDP